MDAALDLAGTSATIDSLVAEASAALSAAGVGSPRLDAELLLATVSGLDRTALYVRGGEVLSKPCTEQFRSLLQRRVRREPLQYIVGRQEFWSLDFLVTPDVLVPRPETELLVELALSVPLFLPFEGTVDKQRNSPSRRPRKDGASSGRTEIVIEMDKPTVRPEEPPSSGGVSKGVPARKSTVPEKGGHVATTTQIPPSPPFPKGEAQGRRRICDVGTGSGCIAVALAHELPSADVWALDVSMRALAVAELNAQRLGVADRLHFLRSDLLAAVSTQRFDVIVSNPPYLTATDLANLQPEVAFEPRIALACGADGLEIIRRLLATAPDNLVAGGWLLMEIGAGQAATVTDLARAAGFSDVSIRSDYAGLPRVLMARR